MAKEMCAYCKDKPVHKGSKKLLTIARWIVLPMAAIYFGLRLFGVI
jgi:hypothetical protein